MEFMLTEENLKKWINIQSDTTVIYEKPKSKPISECIYHPAFMRDKLFWCFYIIVEGVDNYELAKEKLFRFENEFKYKSVLKIRGKILILKKLKLKSIEIESELVTSKIIDLNVFHSLAIAYDKSIIYFSDLVYYDLCYGDEYFLIERKGDNIFLHTGDVKEKINAIRKNLFGVDISKTKRINSISSYTAKELHDIADKLNIEKMIDGKPLTKPLLYAEIAIKIGKLT